MSDLRSSLDIAGELTMRGRPVPRRPWCYLQPATNQVIPATTFTPIIFGAPLAGSAPWWDAANPTYITIPESGLYQLTYHYTVNDMGASDVEVIPAPILNGNPWVLCSRYVARHNRERSGSISMRPYAGSKIGLSVYTGGAATLQASMVSFMVMRMGSG